MKRYLWITLLLLIIPIALNNSTNNISEALYDFLRKLEENNKVKLIAYKDSGGVWTIGYGSIYNYDLKRKVLPGDVITLEQANRFLKIEADSKLADINKWVKVPLTNNQKIALGSLVYNIGAPAFKISTLLKVINAKGTKEAITKEFMRWVYDNGVFVKGLENRRKVELALYFK